MVRPAARRALVHWAREAYQLSERRACRSVGVYRALVRYRSCRPSQAPLRARLRELAAVRLRAPAISSSTCCSGARAGV